MDGLGSLLIGVSFVGLALLALGPWRETSPSPRPIASPDSVATVSAQNPPPVVADQQSNPSATSLQVLLEDDFTDNRMGWPDSTASTAWLADGEYRLTAREPGRFVAVGAPLSMPLGDVVVSARFRKVGGPLGGGYGLIVRDQEPAARDGIEQGGRYYVLEVGDRGEIGIWRREGETWVDVLPWTPSAVVLPGGAPNDVEVWAGGARLSLIVNGIQVASQVDHTLAAGGVGVFVGGDDNQVAVERLMVRSMPDSGQPGQGTAAAPTPAPRSAPPAAPTPEARRPITRVRIPGIALDSEAVPAELISQGGGTTWSVPAFTIGHGQATAGAGGPGNAVLVGHVDSRGLGNVFQDLHKVRLGEPIEIASGVHQFEYRVVDIRTVGRSDVAVVQPTDRPSVTLITCTGLWLPILADYAERLVVRAELAPAAATSN